MISFEVSLPSSFPPPPLLKRLKRSAANTGVDGTDCGGDGDGVLSVLLRDTRLARCFGGGGGGVVGAAELDGTSRRPRARLCHRERTKLTHPPPSMFLFPSLTCRNHLRRAAQRHHSDYLYGAIAAAAPPSPPPPRSAKGDKKPRSPSLAVQFDSSAPAPERGREREYASGVPPGRARRRVP